MSSDERIQQGSEGTNPSVGERKAQAVLAASFAAALRSFSEREIHAFNVTVQLRGHVSPSNCCYQRAVETNLIEKSGYARDLEALRFAAAYEVNRRTKGTDRGQARNDPHS